MLKFLVDECTGPSVARWLREQGHEVFSVYEQISRAGLLSPTIKTLEKR